MNRSLRPASLLVLLLAGLLAVPGCLRGPGRGGGGVLETALVTAAIISTIPPPAPRVVYVPREPQPGYSWQPGYWTRDGEQWVWVEGRWIPTQAGYQWWPAHWEQLPDGTWGLVPGRWVTIRP